MTDTVPPGAPGPGQPALPRTALTQARTEAQRFLGTLEVRGEEAKELARIVDSAIDERFGELDDLRIGRVIGAALATL